MACCDNHDWIVDKIFETYTQCNVKSFPIDCIAILEHYGFKALTYTSLKERSLRLYELSRSFSSDAFTCGNIIAYNDRTHRSRIRFSLMHELGHFVLGHEGGSMEDEEAADCFASNILAPRSAMYWLDLKDAEDVHARFGISYTASNRAWSDYRRRALSEADRRIGQLLFCPKPAQEPADVPAPAGFQTKESAKKAPPKRRRRRNSKKWREIEDRIAFLQEHDPDYFFRAGEYAKLYGNHL